jgi:hypothetical protein
MHTTLHYSFSIKECGFVIFFKAILAFSKVAFAISTTPSLKIPSCS